MTLLSIRILKTKQYCLKLEENPSNIVLLDVMSLVIFSEFYLRKQFKLCSMAPSYTAKHIQHLYNGTVPMLRNTNQNPSIQLF